MAQAVEKVRRLDSQEHALPSMLVLLGIKEHSVIDALPISLRNFESHEILPRATGSNQNRPTHKLFDQPWQELLRAKVSLFVKDPLLSPIVKCFVGGNRLGPPPIYGVCKAMAREKDNDIDLESESGVKSHPESVEMR